MRHFLPLRLEICFCQPNLVQIHARHALRKAYHQTDGWLEFAMPNSQRCNSNAVFFRILRQLNSVKQMKNFMMY